MIIHIFNALLFFLFGLLVQLPILLLGTFIAALPKTSDTHKAKEFTQHPGNYWYPIHLPSWAWLWDNDHDGARGDKRGWYTMEWNPHWPDWLKHYFWLAFRNPANNFKRHILGVDLRKCDIELLAGNFKVRDDQQNKGWQFVSLGGFRYHLYLVKEYGDSGRALVIQLGNKVEPRHVNVTYEEERKYWKGFSFEINPYKDIT